MEYIAIAKNIKTTPRKMRLVVDSIKKRDLNNALSALKIMQKRAAGPIKKAIESAVANATNNFKVNRENLTIANIIVTEGASYKRFHFAARGRTRPYKKRTSHIRVILTDNNIKNPALPAGRQTSNIKDTNEKVKMITEVGLKEEKKEEKEAKK